MKVSSQKLYTRVLGLRKMNRINFRIVLFLWILSFILLSSQMPGFVYHNLFIPNFNPTPYPNGLVRNLSIGFIFFTMIGMPLLGINRVFNVVERGYSYFHRSKDFDDYIINRCNQITTTINALESQLNQFQHDLNKTGISEVRQEQLINCSNRLSQKLVGQYDEAQWIFCMYESQLRLSQMPLDVVC